MTQIYNNYYVPTEFANYTELKIYLFLNLKIKKSPMDQCIYITLTVNH